MFKTIFLLLITCAHFQITLGSEQFFTLKETCNSELTHFPGKSDKDNLEKACSKVSVLNGCYSEVNKKLIFHYDKVGTSVTGKKILVYALFHGDETPSGSVARHWMERLEKINSRNSWRIIPITNPDGLKEKTRTNGRGVDLNRNFPTKKWDELALKYWKEKEGSHKRRFPGKVASSEQETKCVMNHLEAFDPDFIISVHTPYGVLDFDGPENPVKPRFYNLPWKRLGHYPGSLGRYMWAERNVPVLTIELKGNEFNLGPEYLEELQDIAGGMAIKVSSRK
jgi:hypothetical protein